MLSSQVTASSDEVKAVLRRLRQGQALARPASVRSIDARLRELIAGETAETTTADEVILVVAGIRRAIDLLGEHDRLVAQVDFNLVAEHSYPTLTERQESLARVRKCTAKTIRRHADQVLETLALIILTGQSREILAESRSVAVGTPQQRIHSLGDRDDGVDAICRFWGLAAGATVDIVCSEIPELERPEFADPADRNYLRYAKFADLDSLIYVRTRLAQSCPVVAVRDFSPSEHFGTDASVLIVIGGPPWNAKFREFLPQLPFLFEPHPLGEDDPLVVPQLDMRLSPRWTARSELLEDVAVFTRLTLARGTTVYLLAGCLTLGVLAAAQCFLHGDRGVANAAYIDGKVGDADFVMVAQARRVGGIVDVADLAQGGPLLLLARGRTGAFEVVVDTVSVRSDATSAT